MGVFVVKNSVTMAVGLLGGASDFTTFSGVILTISADITGVNLVPGTYVIPWDTKVVDTDGFYSGANPSRITIPSSANGKYGIFAANVWVTSLTASNNFFAQVNKNGSFPVAGPISGSFNNDTQASSNIFSLPFLLSATDFYEVLPYTNADTSVTITAAQSSFSLMVLP